MATSKRKTTVAILRTILGRAYGREDRFAELAQRSVSWVKKVSAGMEPLTEDVARILSLETGIDPTWLLRADPAIAPVSNSGGPYNERSFQLHRAKLSKGKLEVRTVFDLGEIVAEIAGIGQAAARQEMAAVFQWKLTEFIKVSRHEFGCDERVQRQVRGKATDARLPRLVFRDDFLGETARSKPAVQNDAVSPRSRKKRHIQKD